MDKFHVKRPIHPFLSFVFSLFIFGGGLFIAKEVRIILLFGGLVALYALFGYLATLLKLFVPFSFIGLLVAGGTYIISGSMIPAIQTFGRIILLAFSSTPMVGTPPIQLLRVFTQWGFPKILSLGVLVTLRFIPLLILEMRQIMDAMKTRGIRFRWREKRILYRAFFIPLMIRIAGMSDTMSISIETRGFVLDHPEQSVYKPVRFRHRDGVYSFLLISLMMGVMLYG